MERRKRQFSTNLKALEHKRNKFMDELIRSQFVFSFEERTAFLTAIKENGLHVIFDMDLLQKYIPDRKETELKYLVESYQRKSRQRNLERRRAEEEQPLERWKRICEHALKARHKKYDSSQLLIELMKSFEEDYAQKHDKSREYADIYRYLRELMQATIPSDLSVTNSVMLLALLDNLCQLAEKHRPSEDEQLVRQLFDRFKHQEANRAQEEDIEEGNEETRTSLAYFDEMTEEKREKYLKAAKYVLKKVLQPDNRLADEDSESAQEIDSKTLLLVQDRKQNPLHHYSNLPKVQKVKECLNPLQIPVVEMRRQHRHLIELLKSNLDDDDESV